MPGVLMKNRGVTRKGRGVFSTKQGVACCCGQPVLDCVQCKAVCPDILTLSLDAIVFRKFELGQWSDVVRFQGIVFEMTKSQFGQFCQWTNVGVPLEEMYAEWWSADIGEWVPVDVDTGAGAYVGLVTLTCTSGDICPSANPFGSPNYMRLSIQTFSNGLQPNRISLIPDWPYQALYSFSVCPSGTGQFEVVSTVNVAPPSCPATTAEILPGMVTLS